MFLEPSPQLIVSLGIANILTLLLVTMLVVNATAKIAMGIAGRRAHVLCLAFAAIALVGYQFVAVHDAINPPEWPRDPELELTIRYVCLGISAVFWALGSYVTRFHPRLLDISVATLLVAMPLAQAALIQQVVGDSERRFEAFQEGIAQDCDDAQEGIRGLFCAGASESSQ